MFYIYIYINLTRICRLAQIKPLSINNPWMITNWGTLIQTISWRYSTENLAFVRMLRGTGTVVMDSHIYLNMLCPWVKYVSHIWKTKNWKKFFIMLLYLPSLSLFNLVQHTQCVNISGDQPRQFGVEGQHFRDLCLHHQGLMWWMNSWSYIIKNNLWPMKNVGSHLSQPWNAESE